MWYNDVQASYKTNKPSLFIFKVWFCLCDAVATSYVDDFVDPHHRVKRGKERSISNNNLQDGGRLDERVYKINIGMYELIQDSE